MTGQTFSIKRMQTHDGPGIRTTVFMKGCSLRCKWCHNPESLNPRKELWCLDHKCINCRGCETDTGALTRCSNWNGDVSVVEKCPSKALELLGRAWSVEGLIQELERDAEYWKEGGGITVSGGEPAMQWEFVSELLRQCHSSGWHTALDTCGAAERAAFEQILPFTDLILFDLKIANSGAHQKWTGKGNTEIFENLKWICSELEFYPDKQIWIRTPLIPEATASIENIAALGKWLQNETKAAVGRWELCAFNNLCVKKYRQLDLEWDFANTPLIEKSFADLLAARAAEFHPRVFLKGRFAA